MAYITLSQHIASWAILSWRTSFYGLFFVVVAPTLLVLLRKKRSNDTLPPTVPGHWLFKNQKLLQEPWRGVLMAEQYKPQYGDIIQLSTPFKTTIVLNSFEVISEVLEKHSATTSNRPRNVMVCELTGIDQGVAFRQHDEKHKKLRRVMASALHPAAARSYADLHTTTSAYFLNNIMDRMRGDITTIFSKRSPSIIKPTDDRGHRDIIIASIRDTVGRFIMRMTYGHVVVENDPLLAIVNEVVSFIATGLSKHYWVNDFPVLRYIPTWFPGAGFKREAQRGYELRQYATNANFEPVMRDVYSGKVERPSYSSRLLEQKGGINAREEDVELVRWTASAMFTAGATTTTALVHNFIFAMAIRPDIAARVQAEITAQVGRDRIPTLHDRKVLPYTDAVLQEVIRFYPILTLGLQHSVSEDMEIRGYKIKKGTTLEGNIWAIMREHETYPSPHTFDPTRFLKPIPEPDPRRFVFGFGRRVCPGQHVANNGAFTMCAAFMSVFNITAGENTMREVNKCGREVWKMFQPFGPFEPLPFDCTISPRDDAAIAVLDTCRDAAVIS